MVRFLVSFLPRRFRFAPWVVPLFAAWATPAASTPPTAADTLAGARVRAAIEAMGGERALRALDALRLEGFEARGLVGIARDPRDPPIMLRSFNELRSSRLLRSRVESLARMPQRPDPLPLDRTITSETGPHDELELRRWAPERILFEAAADSNLVSLPDTVIGGERLHAVRFGEEDVTLFLDPESRLPHGWSTTRSYPDAVFEWRAWGDVVTRVEWRVWSLEPIGVRYPRLWHVDRNGFRVSTTTITKIEPASRAAIDSLAGLDPAIPPDPDATRPAEGREIADGVVLLPGPFHVLLVRQDEGVVVIQSPHGNPYSQAVIAEAERWFGDEPIRALVLTSGAWPHLAGVRAYVARGVPIHASRKVVERVRALSHAPWTLTPDSLARSPREPLTRVVAGTIRLESAKNPIELHTGSELAAIHSPSSVVVHLPESRLLHAGDLWIPERFEPNLWRQARRELVDLVAARNLEVDRMMALHIEPVPWTEALEGLATDP